MDSALGLILLAGVVGAVWLWHRRAAARSPETELRRICMGDGDQVERLIGSEMSRAPGMSRTEAARRAVDRYRRDNR